MNREVLSTSGHSGEDDYSSEFLAARSEAWDAQRIAARMQLVDPSLPGTGTAQKLAEDLTQRAFEILESDRARKTAAAIEERAAVVMSRPFDDAIERVVALLEAEGPLTATEIEARRIRGLSHNVVRPVLREAVARGLVRRDQNGRRVVWVRVSS